MCCHNGSHSSKHENVLLVSGKLTSRRSAPPTQRKSDERSDSFWVANHSESDQASQYKCVYHYRFGETVNFPPPDFWGVTRFHLIL